MLIVSCKSLPPNQKVYIPADTIQTNFVFLVNLLGSLTFDRCRFGLFLLLLRALLLQEWEGARKLRALTISDVQY